VQLLDLTNKIVVFVAQIVTFIFPIGIAIYVFQYKNWKENLDKYNVTDIIMEQHQRMSKKIIKLFSTGIVTIFYAIFVMIIISQIILNDCALWLLLSGSIILLLLTFFFLRSIFPEIGLTNK